MSLIGAGGDGLLLEGCPVAFLSDVAADGDHVAIVVLLEPRHDDRSVEPAGIREGNLLLHISCMHRDEMSWLGKILSATTEATRGEKNAAAFTKSLLTISACREYPAIEKSSRVLCIFMHCRSFWLEYAIPHGFDYRAWPGYIILSMLFYDRSDGDAYGACALSTPYCPISCARGTRRRYSSPRTSRSRPRCPISAARTARGRSNAGPGPERYSLFGLLIAAAVRTIALKPRLNRFVHRRAIYQRKGISVSFIVKKALTEAADRGQRKNPLRARGRHGDGGGKIKRRASSRSGAARRAPTTGSSTSPTASLSAKPPSTLLFRLLDRFNVAPPRMIEADPLFTSIYVANLGSIGLDTPYHNLYEWGTASVVHGRRQDIPEGTRRSSRGAASGVELKHYVNIKFTVDERIAEGIYFAHAAALFQRFVVQAREPSSFRPTFRRPRLRLRSLSSFAKDR